MSNAMKEFLSTVKDTNRYICPLCSHTRKKKTDRTLSVTVTNEEVKYNCFHCEEGGIYTHKQLDEKISFEKKTPPPPRAISVPKNIDEEIIKDYLLGRGIDYDRIKDKFKIVSGQKYFAAKGDLDAGETQAIGFVYGQNEAVKWRPVADKRFIQDGSAITLWGIEQIRARVELPKNIIICEGEIDCLSIAMATDIDVMSVPNGAPSKISDRKVDPTEDKKFNYLWEAKDVINHAQKIILITDSDEAGEALREEIARRVGRAKCYQVQFPEHLNDPNDLLVTEGPDALAKLISGATPLPLDGIYSAEEYAEKVHSLFDNGMMKGESTGIVSVDELFTIAPGQLSVVTGVPGSGKSEFIDQLMINLAQNKGWKFAVASFENPPDLHIAKLSEKYVGKPFFDGDDRMTKEEVINSGRWVNDHFMFVEQRGGDVTTVDSILDRISQACLRVGIRGAVIDPYNYIVQDHGSEENEHQFINQLLTRLVAFARAYDIHIWFVAHPAKMPTNADGTTAVPKGMNISGSASFFAKADLGVTIHRVGDVTEVHAWKVRFKWLGKVGSTKLQYHVKNGRYGERTLSITNAKFGNSRRRSDDDDIPF